MLAAGPLRAIASHYAIEAGRRHASGSPAQRAIVRRQVLEGLCIDRVLLRRHATVMPKSPLSRAIDCTFGLWPKLKVFLRNGEVEIDNNGIENAIRPTAVGKKNWMFVGGEDTGDHEMGEFRVRSLTPLATGVASHGFWHGASARSTWMRVYPKGAERKLDTSWQRGQD